MTQAGQLSDADLDRIDGKVARLIDEAVAEAKAAEKPGPADLESDVYICY